MYESEHNFGLVKIIKPESLGRPGKRVFRLLIDGKPPAAATLWLEKEQLYGLSMAIKKLMESEAVKEDDEEASEEERVLRLDDSASLEGSSGEILEFKVGRLGLALGPGKEHLTLFFHDERDEPDTPLAEDEGEGYGESFEEESSAKAKLRVSINVSESDAFVNESLDLCASGRGTDSLSRQALVATGKVDPNRNGHFRH